MRMELVVRFDHGLSVPWINTVGDGLVHVIGGPQVAIAREDVVTHQNAAMYRR
jgi:hypothetical protein